MGYDITYHPLSEEDLRSYVINVVANPVPETYRPLLSELTTEGEDQEFIESGIYSRFPEFKRKILNGKGNAKSTTGFAAAALAGYLHPYWYCRNGALSYLCENEAEFASFMKKDWGEIPENLRLYFEEAFTPFNDHYQAGVYIPADKIKALKLAIEDSMYNEAVSEHIGYRNYDCLLSAISYCEEHEVGLLEATDIFVPISGETSTFHDNLRAPYLKNIDDYNNSRKIQYRPATFEDCLSYIQTNEERLRDGSVDVRVERMWLDRFDEGTYDFLLHHCKSAKIAIAKHSRTKPDVLEQLAFDRSVVAYDGKESTCHDHFLAMKVVENPATPSYVLEKIHRAYPEQIAIHTDLARHQNASARLLANLARHPDASVRWGVIANPNATREILHILRNDTERQNRLKALRELARNKTNPLWFKVLFFPIILPIVLVAMPLVFPWQYFRNRSKERA